MIQILDTSTLLNLANGEVLSKILQLPLITFQVSAMVREESRTIAPAISAAVSAGRLSLVDDTIISATRFAAAKNEWQLGSGETECILAAQTLGCSVASDDLAARKLIITLLGEQRLSGSIGLLRDAIAAGLLQRGCGYNSYLLMRSRGGFLPEIAESEFY